MANISFTGSPAFRGLVAKVTPYGITQQECIDGILSACEFFGIPSPLAIIDATGSKRGTAMLPGSTYSTGDDGIRFNLAQLWQLNVRGKEAFTLVMTHECAHRVFQTIQFQGKNGGAWEEELACDFFMGVRAGLNFMNTDDVSEGLGSTRPCPTHPTGYLRKEFIRQGKCSGMMNAVNGRPPRFDKYMNTLSQLLQTFRPNIVEEQAKVDFNDPYFAMRSR